MKTEPVKETYLYPRNFPGIKIVRTDDVYFYDENNKKYIDLSSSAATVAIGYNNQRIKKVMRQQAEKNIFSPQLYDTEESALLAKKILSLFPTNFNSVLRATTGSEAVEIAMKIAIRYTGRKKFLSFKGAYHGHTLATMSLGDQGRLRDFQPFLPHFTTISHPLSFGQRLNSVNNYEKTLKSIERKLRQNNCAGFITEGIVTSAGCFNFPKDFFKKLFKICKKYGTLLVFDEVLTGFGRTGKMFSFEYFDISPDIVCIAKGLSSGYAPMAAVVTRKDIVGDFVYLSSFAWSPLSCAIAMENINIIEEKKLVKNSKELGLFTLNILRKKLKKFQAIKDIRGKGLVIAIEFFNKNDAREIFVDCLKKGVLLFKNYSDSMLFIQPPLCIKKKTLKKALDTVMDSIGEYFN